MNDKISQRNKIVENNLRLVTSRVIALNNGIYNDDLYQVGCIGLIKAADRFNKSLGFKFTTYAVAYIDGDIKRYKSREWEVRKNETIFDETDEKTELPHFYDDIITEIYINNIKKHLPEKDKNIFELRENGLTTTQIGQKVGISQTQVSRALIKIKKKYKNYDEIGG